MLHALLLYRWILECLEETGLGGERKKEWHDGFSAIERGLDGMGSTAEDSIVEPISRRVPSGGVARLNGER